MSEKALTLKFWLIPAATVAFLFGLGGAGDRSLALDKPSAAINGSVQSILIPVGRDELNKISITVKVWPGRATTIDFTPANEIITYVNLGDPSRLVYTADAPIESRTASTLVLKLIQELNFEGLTRSDVTNLIVKTVTRDGLTNRTYAFNVEPSAGTPQYSGLAIHPVAPSAVQAVRVSTSAAATLDDIERGLAIAQREGYVPRSDPVIFKVAEFLALARNGTPIEAAAKRTNLSLSVISALGKLGVEERYFPVKATSPPSRTIKPNELKKHQIVAISESGE